MNSVLVEGGVLCQRDRVRRRPGRLTIPERRAIALAGLSSIAGLERDNPGGRKWTANVRKHGIVGAGSTRALRTTPGRLSVLRAC